VNRMIETLPVHVLVERAKGGDRLAFESLFRATHAQVYNFLLALGLNRDEADDLCQETYVHAWDGLRRLRRGESFVAWLHRIARNLAKDYFRSRSRHPETISSDAGAGQTGVTDGPDGYAEARALAVAVRKGIEALPEPQRLPLVMHHVEGMPVADISRVLGVAVGTVLSRLARGRAALARRLAPFVEPAGAPEGEKDVLQG